MTKLDEIAAHKKSEVAKRKELYPIKRLETSIYFKTRPVSLTRYLLRPDKVGIISEIKRRSPSRGILNDDISIEKVSIGYMQAGSSALSILTDEKYFGGSHRDLTEARKFNYCPILEKDFIVDEYQILEAKAIGADAVLLIAALLSKEQIESYAGLASSLGMESVLEIHDAGELDQKFSDKPDIIGINNRSLKDLTVDTKRSLALLNKLPGEKVKISESGIDSPETAFKILTAGFSGLLIGEFFMTAGEPHLECASFIKRLKKLLSEHNCEN